MSATRPILHWDLFGEPRKFWVNSENSWSTQKILGKLRKFCYQKPQARNFSIVEFYTFNLLFIVFLGSEFFLTFHPENSVLNQKILALPENSGCVIFLVKNSVPHWISGMLLAIVKQWRTKSLLLALIDHLPAKSWDFIHNTLLSIN